MKKMRLSISKKSWDNLNKRGKYEHNAIIQNFVGVENISVEINQLVQPDLLKRKIIDVQDTGVVFH